LEIPASITPVALDLNGDGIDWLLLNEGAKFDYGAGLLATAWVGSNDGLLAYDYNQDGLINEAKEIVFTTWAPHTASDLQALQAYFDSNNDNVLSQIDAGWSRFGVWVDSNSDGVNQLGEFTYLKEAGIESINLTYDHNSSSSIVAEGDVSILGTSSFTWDAEHGGGTGTAADVAFAAGSIQGPPTISSLADASSSLPDQADIPTLISSYLDTIAQHADSNGDGVADQSPGSAELAYHLDSMITDFIDHHGLSDGAYASIHQDLMDHLAHGINEVIPGQDQDLAFNEQGHVADDSAVLAALDQHIQDLVDHHSRIVDLPYHDTIHTETSV
jgi:hypothetical protein